MDFTTLELSELLAIYGSYQSEPIFPLAWTEAKVPDQLFPLVVLVLLLENFRGTSTKLRSTATCNATHSLFFDLTVEMKRKMAL